MTTMTIEKEKTAALPELATNIQSGEAMVFCPKCKATQSVFIQDRRLMPTRKFSQVGRNIYHDCGSTQPCRIYRDW